MKNDKKQPNQKVIVLLMVAVLALSFAACGGNKGGSMDKNPKNAKEAKAMYNSLMAQENEILSKNKDLWEKCSCRRTRA